MKRISLRLGLVTILAVAGLTMAAPARADVLDCTSGCFQTFHGALFIDATVASTGTGVIDSFVRVGGPATVVDGHNTDGRPLLNNENSSPSFTHDLQLKDIPVFNVLGVLYYEFLLDINQEGNDPLLALNAVEICTDASGGLTEANGCPGTTKYTMGGYNDGSTFVLMDYNRNNGSGSGDLFMYIPVATLGTNGADFVYLYSQFGVATQPVTGLDLGYGNNDGFEEWATRLCTINNPCAPPVPEPGSVMLLGMGILGMAAFVRRTRRSIS